MLHTSLPIVATPNRHVAVLPPPGGLEEGRRLRVLVVDDQEVVHWGFKTLMATNGRVSARAARAAGAFGFVPKHWPAQDIANAARMVGLGMTVFAPEADGEHAMLSERERQVLEMIASGSTNREIAERLFLSPHTVKDHTSALYRKIGARNRAQAILRAQRLGILG